jgi:hypothetical protein
VPKSKNLNPPKKTLLDELNALEENFEDDTPTSYNFCSFNTSPVQRTYKPFHLDI